MSDWNLNGNGGGTKAEFTKFAPGITQIRVIDEVPHMRWTHWFNQFKRSFNCPGKGCPICEIRKQQKANKEPYTIAMSKRFSLNIMNYGTGKIEIMEQGVGFFEDLHEVKEQVEKDANGKPTNKKLIDATIKVKRRGTTKDDTKYKVDLDEIDELDTAEVDDLKSKVTDLNEFFKPNTIEQGIRLINGETWDAVMKQENNEESSNEEEIEIS